MGKSVVDIKDTGRALQKIVTDAGIDGKRVVFKEMQDMARYKFPQAVARFYPSVLRVRSGRLRQSFEGFMEEAGGTAFRVGMRSRNVSYATIQHEGGRVPERFPVRAKAMRWIGPDGNPVYAKRAKGFDIKPKKFFSEPMQTEIDPMLKRIKDKIGFRP